ncbi:MAG TPA: FtsK/SpoIIIE domain-containing protein [Segeticoccus sp.]|nr:FtsK/SpoIIIE domain-containing protein [Segeticoccus sp.]
MKLKFTLRSSGDVDTDLVATCDGTTTVGDLAGYLALADPHRSTLLRTPEPGSGAGSPLGEHTLSLVEQSHRALDPRATIAESGLRSGVHVAVTRRSDSFVDAGPSVATVVVTAGPDQGAEFPLASGTAYLGRGRGCEVRLSDSSVSRQHARLLVSEVAEVADLGSSNGVLVEGERVDRAVLRPDDRVRLGDTELQVRMQRAVPGVVSNDGASVAFSRSPRIAPLYEGHKFDVPELPERPKPERMPWITAFAPALFGLAMFLVLRRWYYLLFILMSPIMYFGHAIEARRHAKQDYADAMADFREDLGHLSEVIRQELGTEGEGRRAEHPSATEALESVRQRNALLWTRRRGDPGFLELRLGLGTLPSRNLIVMPQVGRSRAEAWLEVEQSLRDLYVVPDVPVTATPLETGAIGVSGPRSTALPAARALLLQVVGLHSPADVVVAAFASTSSGRDWDWLKWLPHTASPHSPVTARHLASSAPACSALLAELEDLVARGADRHTSPEEGLPEERPAVFVLVEDDAPVERSRLVQLAEQGAQRGVVVLWVSSTTQLLPAACRTFVETNAGGAGPASGAPTAGATAVGYVGEAVVRTPVAVDTATGSDLLETARRLAPVVDSGAPVDDDSDLPRSVSFLALAGSELATSENAVIERWGESRSVLTGPYAAARPVKGKPGNLRAVVGQSAQGTLAIDLKSDGPHALVGGTTGAGKSELLQAWILGMAASHSPQRVTFLLVDYKGGSAFRDCVRLPHTVGLVTDLSPHLVRRALASLSAELRFREHILAQHKAKDLAELERRGEVEAPPSLVIVVDEFAALVQEVPDFVDGVVNVAQRGRSLGLHLILATQRPAGVIKDNLRANTNLRMALRMADEADSEDVLGTPAAAFFDPSIPGRAMSKSGPGRLVPFQAAYAGGWTSDSPAPPEIGVETLGFGAGEQWELPVLEEEQPEENLGPTDIQRVVERIGLASRVAELPDPRKPWLPELQPVYDLASLPTRRRDDEIVFAVADDPTQQAQPIQSFNPDREGNIAVFGASGAGKSVFLRSVAVAAGFTVRGGPCQVYGLDFAGRGLAMLEHLPHVGSIVAGGEHERVVRLLRHLRQTIDDRAVRYSRVNAATITEYRRLAGDTDEPRLFVLLDGLAAFRQAYETAAGGQWMDLLSSIAADGRPVGVHVVMTVEQRAALWGGLASAVQQRIVMRMSTADDYSALDVPGDVLSMASPPGRALMNGREIQVAVLGGTSDVSKQSRAMTAFGEAVAKAGGRPAPPIRSLPERVGLDELPVLDAEQRPVVGVSSETLEPVGFGHTGSWLVIGPSGSGRSTTLHTIVQSLLRADGVAASADSRGGDGDGRAEDELTAYRTGLELFLFTPRPSVLSGLGGWAGVAVRDEACEQLAERLRDELASGTDGRRLGIVIERAPDLEDGMAERPLERLSKLLLDEEQLVVAEGTAQFFSSSFGLPGVLRAGRSGISLQPDGMDSQAFNVDYPGVAKAQLLEGRGYLVRRGRHELVQVALPAVTAGGRARERSSEGRTV